MEVNLQGTFIKRHKIPKADESPLTPEDIRVADSLTVYGHVFHIVDADEFTRCALRDCLPWGGLIIPPLRCVPALAT